MLLFSSAIFAQIVTTFAGTVDSVGATDGIEAATFNNPHGIAISPNGIIYICDRFNHTIRKININGDVTTLAGHPGISGDTNGQGNDARFYEPWGICVDQNENVFITDTRNNKIKKITSDGWVSTYAGTGNFGTTDGVSDNCTFGQPVGIETDGNGNLFVSDHGTHIIRKISSDGLVTTLAGAAYEAGDADGVGPDARFNKPYGLTIDQDGNIIIADEWNHKIRKITPNGIVSTIAGTGIAGGLNEANETATFNFPWDVAVDSHGDIYVADGINFAIRKIELAANFETTTYAGKIGSSGYQDGVGGEARFSGATGLAFSPMTRELFVGDAFNQVVRKISDPSQGVFLMTHNNVNTYCPNESIFFTAFPGIFEQYQFYIDNEIVATEALSNFDAIGLEPGTHSAQVVATLGAIEMTSDEISFEVFSVDQATIDTIGNTTFFEGDSVILIANFGTDYFWSTGEDTPTLTVREAGTYSVEVTDANNCSSVSSSVEITVQSDPDAILIDVDGPTTICEGESVTFHSSQTENVQWLRDGWPIFGANSDRYQAVEPGNYQAQYIDPNGVVVISSIVQIDVLPGLEIDFQADKSIVKINENIKFSIISNNTVAATWNFGDSNAISSTDLEPIHQYTDIGTYDVQLIGIDTRGCSDTLLKTNLIRVISEQETELENDLFIASAFTPNGDGSNDFLLVRGSDILSMEFKVFSDTGHLVFESNTQNIGWDGTWGTKKAPSGNYIYELNYTDLQGSKKFKIGKTALLK